MAKDTYSQAQQDLISDAMREFSEYQLWRNTLASQCEEIARLIWPEWSNTFYYQNFNWPGQKQTQSQVDATGMLALRKYRRIVDSIMTPQGMVWHQLGADDDYVMKDRATRLWFEQVNKILFAQRYKGTAGFVQQNSVRIGMQGAFGTGVMFVDELDDKLHGQRGLRYKSIPLGEAYLRENHQGIVDGWIRAFRLNARQIYQRWKDAIPETMMADLEARSEFPRTILHRICPQTDYDGDAYDYRGMPYHSCYILVDGGCLLQEGGYRSLPVIASRCDQEPTSPYGRSPAMAVLPSLKTLNSQKRTLLKQGHRAADPVLLTADDGLVDFSLRPGAINRGGMNADGRPMVGVLPSGNVQINEKMMEIEAAIVNDPFHVELFKLAEETREMSAREVFERISERSILLAPELGAMHADFVEPSIHRELDILSWLRLLPPMPPRLKEAGGNYKVVNTSPLARAVRSTATAGFMRAVEMSAKVAQLTGSPEALDWANFDVAMPAIAQDEFAPESWTNDQKAIAKVRQGRAQAAERDRQTKELPGKAAIIKAQAIQAKAQAGQNIGGTLSGVPSGQMPEMP
jgi:Bacteriophage head to tail connecting protein